MDDRELCDAVQGNLCDVLHREGEMVTKWLAIVEVVDADGKRWIRTLCNEGAACWDNLGLLTYGLQYEQAAAVGGFSCGS